jgi:hypothetical protein
MYKTNIKHRTNKWAQKKKQMFKGGGVKDFPQGRERMQSQEDKERGSILESGKEPLDLCEVLNLKKISIETDHESLSD